MYRDSQTIISKDHKMYEYFKTISEKANNLYNAALFRQRQVMTAVSKLAEGIAITDNEKEVMDEIEYVFSVNPDKYRKPSAGRWALSYEFMDWLLKLTKNPDYCCELLPSHCAQHIIKNACRDMKAFRKSIAAYNKDSSAFTGRPKLPGYHKKNGCCTFYFSNQECIRKDNIIKFPYTKLTLGIPKSFKESWKLKQVTVEPFYDSFKVHMIFDDGSNEKECSSKSRHVCAIDLGVNNFAAVTNNKGLPCLLFRGGIVKSINHLYNTRYAEIQSAQTKGTTDKFITTPEVKALSEKRDNILSDLMHKTAKRIIDWCIDNEIDTVVVGENKGWKQSVELGKVQNQNFVQIPYTRFKNILRYLCQWNGIICITQEESYTSKASFLDNDEIPVYGDDGTITFSGKRGPNRYKNNTAGTGSVVSTEVKTAHV